MIETKYQACAAHYSDLGQRKHVHNFRNLMSNTAYKNLFVFFQIGWLIHKTACRIKLCLLILLTRRLNLDWKKIGKSKIM